MSDKLSDERDSIEYAIQVLRQVEAGDGTFVGQCADAIEGLEAILAASPAPAIPAVDPVAIRDAALEAAAAAVEDHQRAGREWINESLWGALSREAAARIRALKAAPAISESEPVFKVGDHVCMKHPSIYPDFGVVEQITHPGGLRVRSSVTGKLVTFLTRDTELDRYAAIDAARKGEKS